MELFQNSPETREEVMIQDEFLHCHEIVNTQKIFRFLEMDIDMTPQKWRCLNWELQEEQDGSSLTASNANPYIITP
jgi:predicted transcriptional regulator